MSEQELFEISDRIRTSIPSLAEHLRKAVEAIYGPLQGIVDAFRAIGLIQWPERERSHRNVGWWRGRKMSEGMRRHYAHRV